MTECPSLSGDISQGETKEPALDNIEEAIEGYELVLEEVNATGSACGVVREED